MVLIAISVIPLYAETEDAFIEYPQALGFSGGNIIGPGISWMNWTGRTGVQLAAGILYSPPDADSWYSDDVLDYSLGAEVLRRMYGDTYAPWFTGQLYIWGSLKHHGFIPVVEKTEIGTEEYEYSSGDYTPGVAVGAGIGIEMIIFKHFSIPFEFGYLAEMEFLSDDAVPLTVDLATQGGIRYRY